MDEIATVANVAKGTLYYHFKSKGAIFAYIVEAGIDVIYRETYAAMTDVEDPLVCVFYLHQKVNHHRQNCSLRYVPYQSGISAFYGQRMYVAGRAYVHTLAARKTFAHVRIALLFGNFRYIRIYVLVESRVGYLYVRRANIYALSALRQAF